MATRQLSPTTIGAIIAAVFVVLVLGYMGLTFARTAAEPLGEVAHQYDTQILSTELSATNDKSVFLYTVPLQAFSQTSGGIPYNANELGKTDITTAGR
jgi:hypothetical protein